MVKGCGGATEPPAGCADALTEGPLGCSGESWRVGRVDELLTEGALWGVDESLDWALRG